MIQNLKIKAEILLSFLLFAVCFFSSATISAQTVKIKPKPKTTAINNSNTPAEKSLATDAKVNISLCISEGKINIQGWDRNEIRAYVSSGGSQVGFRVMEKNKSEKPVWVMVLGFDPNQTSETESIECLSGDEIELDVPRGATVNIKSRESETKIEAVGKVSVKNVGGDIFLSDISNGIKAETYRGNVTVGNSGGEMILSSSAGNIVAYNAAPSEIGDIFKANTINGAITLQDIEHRQVEINSQSGSIKFSGEILTGGQYSFGTHTGAMLFSIPEKSSCKITAFFGFGQFSSDIKLENEKKSPISGAQNLTAQIGTGEAALNLKTFNGRILIRKADK